jgi:DNA gyrase subunit A
VCERGYGKRTPLEEFRQQKRGGKGIILIDTSERNGPVVGLALVHDRDEVMLVTDRGQMLRTRVAEIRETGRNAQGVRVMNVEADERVVAIEPVGESEDEEVTGPSAEGESLNAAAPDAATVGGGDGALELVEPIEDDATGSDATGSDDTGSDEPS